MHLNEIRRRVDALRRKLVLELAVVKLHRLVWEFAVKWGVALAGNQPVPEPHSLPRKVGATGVRVTSHMAATKYLEECQDKNTALDAQKLLYRLLPCAVFNDTSPTTLSSPCVLREERDA